jgi:cytochrome c553
MSSVFQVRSWFIAFCCSAGFLACGSPDLTREAAAHLLVEEAREQEFDPDSVNMLKVLVMSDLIKEEDNLWRAELGDVVLATFYWSDGEWMVVLSTEMRNALPKKVKADERSRRVESRPIVDGAAVFATNCATCHGDDGTGGGAAAVGLEPPPADLTDATWTTGDGSLIAIRDVIGNGSPGTAMISWRGTLTQHEIVAVARYVHSFGDRK